jgi:Protein of unknown function (DUF2914)
MPSSRLAAVASTALVLAAPAAEPAAAPVGYVYYLQTFGDWTVTCGRDESSGRDNCTLSAPPPERHGDSQIEIGNGQGDNGAVTLRVRGALMPDSPLYLRVDAEPPHQTQPNRFGEGGWSGQEAQTIIGELNAGQRVVVRSFSGPPPVPRDAYFSLERFDEALADFDKRAGGKPPSPAAPPPLAEAEKPRVTAESSPAPVTPPPQMPTPPPTPTQTKPVQEEPPVVPVPEPPKRQPEPASSQPSAPDGGAVTILDDAHVGRAKLTTNVVNREPVDELGSTVQIPSSGEDFVYFFTEIRGMAGRTVTHRWQYGGSIVASVPFPIGSDRWRVYSRKAISANQAGAWTVTAVGPNGSELARAAFTAE